GLFSTGHISDCLIGCEFILKMDPRFTPAKRLQEKARNRDSDVDISELQAFAAGEAPFPGGAAPSAPSPAPLRPTAVPPPAPVAPAPARPEKPDADRLLAEAGLKVTQRDFDGAIALASQALGLKPGNPEALAIIEKAAGRRATQPLVESSRSSCERALAEGRLADARFEVERIRSLDSDHPAIAFLETRLASAASSAGGADPSSDFSLDQEDTAEMPLSGPGALSLADPADGDESPEMLAPVISHPASFTEIGEPGAAGGSFLLEPPSPGEEFLVPPSPPTPDLFLAPNGATAADYLPPPPDDEESQNAEQEIARLLVQGDEVSKKGDRQQAIEIWSRVFLIDINNAEAVTRIEKARQEMSEEGRLVGDLLKKGRDSFEAGDRDTARQIFLQAQALDPDEATARFYLERIEKEVPGSLPVPAAAAPRPATPTPHEDDFSRPATTAPVMPAPRKAGLSINPRVLGVVGAFVVLTLVGVYFVFKGGGRAAPEPSAKIVASGSLQRARDLVAKGKTEEARAELRRIGATDPDFDEARKMLSEIGGKGGAAASGGKAAASVEPGAPSARVESSHAEADPARLRATAEKALAEKRYIDALKNFNLAAPSYRDDPTFAKGQGLASDKVTALTPAVKFYNEGEYETAIPILWRIVQEDKENQDARSYLLRAYYNQGITQLQNGLYPKAAQAFGEALALDPNDAESARHKKFAERYQKGDLDLMGRIYVRHLNRRP
ncbi:MAG TPA: tetratricopeptide repeat protein, partial [Thermoanaerobaculia bacterium]|nr:tetratricopeptide repeat protein [Thermoanaerobaculia bacterium]